MIDKKVARMMLPEKRCEKTHRPFSRTVPVYRNTFILANFILENENANNCKNDEQLIRGKIKSLRNGFPTGDLFGLFTKTIEGPKYLTTRKST